jgi:4-amino-4-deoxy-L-arabinose transferase-like glycosyltransferase
LQEYLSSTALSDATLGLLLVLSTLVIMRIVRKPSWAWTIVLGILFGCGMAAKLSPIALAVGFGGIGFLFLIRRPVLMKIPGINRLVTYLARGREEVIDRLAWMFLSLPIITVGVFVALYPYVWSAPYSRTRILFDFRTQEMRSQSRIWPNLKINGPIDALDRLWHVFQQDYPSTGKIFAKLAENTPFPSGVPSFDIVIVGLGLLLAVITVIRTGVATPMAFAFYLLGGQTAAIIVGLKVDFNRYYLPILIFGAVCFGYLTGEVAKFIVQEIEVYRNSRSKPDASQQRMQLPASVPFQDK